MTPELFLDIVTRFGVPTALLGLTLLYHARVTREKDKELARAAELLVMQRRMAAEASDASRIRADSPSPYRAAAPRPGYDEEEKEELPLGPWPEAMVRLPSPALLSAVAIAELRASLTALPPMCSTCPACGKGWLKRKDNKRSILWICSYSGTQGCGAVFARTDP